VRARAEEWHIDPKRVGMMGFSAGAGTTMAATLQSTEIKPAFIAPIYGSLRNVDVPADAPPMFVALAADDPLFGKSDFALISAWQKAGRPVEFHLYQNGGHGFGLGNPPKTSTGWFPQFMLCWTQWHVERPVTPARRLYCENGLRRFAVAGAERHKTASRRQISEAVLGIALSIALASLARCGPSSNENSANQPSC
jgi:acetyl esterase/lipase